MSPYILSTAIEQYNGHGRRQREMHTKFELVNFKQRILGSQGSEY
jgi:hypothetical protein